MLVQEYCEDCPEQSKLVRRDASFKDNNALPAQIALRTGDFIYDGLRNGFRVSSRALSCCLHTLMHQLSHVISAALMML